MPENNTKQFVNWDAAATLVGKIAPPGPRLPKDQAAEVVSGLREAGLAAVEPVIETTQMRPADGLPQDSFGEIIVVDRTGWASTNLKMMGQVAGPTLNAMAEVVPVSPATRAGAAGEVAAMMAVMAPRVLGQFDPYTSLGHVDASGIPSASAAVEPQRGQLLLVAPNVAQVERELEVNPQDFRLWVALHEQTHGLQFAAAPWLAPYLYAKIGGLLAAMSDKSVEAIQGNAWEKFLRMLGVARDVFNSVVHTDGPGPVEALLGPTQKEAFDTISATMALLEGHADVMMDEAGPAVVPTVTEIREKFEKRRDGVGQAKAGVLLRRLLGMDAKLAQYRDGATFVRGVEAKVGRPGLNAIWVGPENLPTPAEIMEPKLWVTRIHG
jgi:coenzyme F420 biosynthesis associated uncharacterized protein